MGRNVRGKKKWQNNSRARLLCNLIDLRKGFIEKALARCWPLLNMNFHTLLHREDLCDCDVWWLLVVSVWLLLLWPYVCKQRERMRDDGLLIMLAVMVKWVVDDGLNNMKMIMVTKYDKNNEFLVFFKITKWWVKLWLQFNLKLFKKSYT
jgi:hypothetical protein